MSTGASATDMAHSLAAEVAELDEDSARRILSLVAAGVEIARPPRSALAMMTARDPFDTTFCVGEVLVTEAAVGSGDLRGWGVALGDAPQRALLQAAIDLLGRTEDLAGLERAAGLVSPEARRAAGAREREAALVARTRVQFDLMPSK